MNKEADPIFGLKSVAEKASGAKSLTNGKRVTLSLSQETTEQLIQQLTALKGNERGTKIDVHYGTKQTEEGRTFLGGFFFVRGIQEFGAAATAGKFVPKAAGAETKAAAAAEAKRLG